jgi:hypothetical protein
MYHYEIHHPTGEVIVFHAKDDDGARNLLGFYAKALLVIAPHRADEPRQLVRVDLSGSTTLTQPTGLAEALSPPGRPGREPWPAPGSKPLGVALSEDSALRSADKNKEDRS